MAIATEPRLTDALAELGQALLGKPQALKLAVTCLLAGGHLLIEDLPGVGKTTLAHALARVFGLDWRRVQFTSDLLPADILGVSIFDTQRQAFRFRAGPVFTQLLLADEINRAPPKTQSALLEAMEEGQVTIEGHTHSLPHPFFVVATQNPQTQTGTYALPESQLDRFLIKLSLGYPDSASERQLLIDGGAACHLEQLRACLSTEALQAHRLQVSRVHVSAELLDYLQRLLAASRDATEFVYGLSPRAGLGLLQAAKAWAWLAGRDYVLPDDIQTLLAPVCNHRLVSVHTHGQAAAEQLLANVAVV